MPLTLKIVSEHADLVGDDNVREFRDEGGTIGRGCRTTGFCLTRIATSRDDTPPSITRAAFTTCVDTSSNGIYVNDEYEPVGKGNTFGGCSTATSCAWATFIFDVSVDAGETIAVPLDDEDEPTGHQSGYRRPCR